MLSRLLRIVARGGSVRKGREGRGILETQEPLLLSHNCMILLTFGTRTIEVILVVRRR